MSILPTANLYPIPEQLCPLSIFSNNSAILSFFTPHYVIFQQKREEFYLPLGESHITLGRFKLQGMSTVLLRILKFCTKSFIRMDLWHCFRCRATFLSPHLCSRAFLPYSLHRLLWLCAAGSFTGFLYSILVQLLAYASSREFRSSNPLKLNFTVLNQATTPVSTVA